MSGISLGKRLAKEVGSRGLIILLILSTTPHTLLTATIFDSDVTLSGQVVDDDGKPLNVIHIKVVGSYGSVLDRILELKQGGKVTVSLGELKDDTVRCYISADGFETTQITAIVQGGRALFGIAKLKRYIELGSIDVLRDADGQVVSLDFWVTSRTSRPLIVKQVGIKGEEVRQGPCFDSTPRLSFQFKNIEVEGKPKNGDKNHKLTVSLLIRPGGTKDKERIFQVGGTFYRELCGPSVIKLVARYSFSIEGSEENRPIKLRITVPSRFKLKHVGLVRPDWDRASIFVTLDKGETISAEPAR